MPTCGRARSWGCSPGFERSFCEAMFGPEEFEDEAEREANSAWVPANGVPALVRSPGAAPTPPSVVRAELSNFEVTPLRKVGSPKAPEVTIEAPSKRLKMATRFEIRARLALNGCSNFETHSVEEWETVASVSYAQQEIATVSGAACAISWCLVSTPLDAVARAFEIMEVCCNLYSYVGVCSSPVYRMMKKGYHRAPSTLQAHFPRWSHMHVIYADEPRWVVWVESEVIRQFHSVFERKRNTPAQRFLANISKGGEGFKETVEHMFVYVLSDNNNKTL